jgi:hypothetical protein
MISDKKTCFLFGSGISLHAGMPSTLDLSNQILTGQGVRKHPSGPYLLGTPSSHDNLAGVFDDGSALNGILLLLSQIKAQADVHYRGGSQSNYEDWFYLADQLASAQGDFDNPAIWDFLENLRPRVEHKNPYALSTQSVEDRSRELCRYIRDIVILRLLQPAQHIKLDWILDGLKDKDMPSHGIFTLNHDRVLETLFEANGIEYTVGFERKVENSPMLHWDSNALFEQNNKVVLAKLHGSVDWRQQNNLGQFLREKDRRLLAFRRRDEDQTPDCEPVMLIGRHNKLYHYNNFLFEDLHYRFYLSLKAANVLVICGYGFGDKGINSRIINWKFSNRENVIVYVREKRPFDDGARLAIHQSMADWQNDPTLAHVSKNAESVVWSDIKDAILRTDQS